MTIPHNRIYYPHTNQRDTTMNAVRKYLPTFIVGLVAGISLVGLYATKVPGMVD